MDNAENLYPGKIVVDDYGISEIIDIDNNGTVTAITIMKKETFIEAYNKYIKEGTD